MEIDIYADVICPWCYIGKHRLEQALQTYDKPVTVRYRPYQLDPSPVPEPRLLLDVMTAHYGSASQARQKADQITQAGADNGLRFNLDRSLTANTFDAHRLARYATEHGRGTAMVDALYRAYFADGVDLGSRAALASLAAEVGLPADEVRAYLDSDAGSDQVRADLATARKLGVTSVPTFLFAGKYVVTGAQDPSTLLAALAEVERREATTTA